MVRPIFIFLLITIVHVRSCASQSQGDSTNSTSKEVQTYNLVARRLGNLWNWVKEQSRSEETFIGRCFGIGRKLKFAMPLVIFLLGVIVTMMQFLTLFTLKGLGVGVLLLILNVGTIFAKIGAFFKHDTSGQQHHPPQNVHFHLHNKDGQYHVDHSSTGWADRVSEGLSNTNSLAEKMELINLYKRLGFNVNNLPVFRYS